MSKRRKFTQKKSILPTHQSKKGDRDSVQLRFYVRVYSDIEVMMKVRDLRTQISFEMI